MTGHSSQAGSVNMAYGGQPMYNGQYQQPVGAQGHGRSASGHAMPYGAPQGGNVQGGRLQGGPVAQQSTTMSTSAHSGININPHPQQANNTAPNR